MRFELLVFICIDDMLVGVDCQVNCSCHCESLTVLIEVCEFYILCDVYPRSYGRIQFEIDNISVLACYVKIPLTCIQNAQRCD